MTLRFDASSSALGLQTSSGPQNGVDSERSSEQATQPHQGLKNNVYNYKGCALNLPCITAKGMALHLASKKALILREHSNKDKYATGCYGATHWCESEGCPELFGITYTNGEINT